MLTLPAAPTTGASGPAWTVPPAATAAEQAVAFVCPSSSSFLMAIITAGVASATMAALATFTAWVCLGLNASPFRVPLGALVGSPTGVMSTGGDFPTFFALCASLCHLALETLAEGAADDSLFVFSAGHLPARESEMEISQSTMKSLQSFLTMASLISFIMPTC